MTDNPPFPLGDYLAELRAERGLSQHGAAELDGTPTQGYISKVESGKVRNVTPEVLARWVVALGGDTGRARELLEREFERSWATIQSRLEREASVRGSSIGRAVGWLLNCRRPASRLKIAL